MFLRKKTKDYTKEYLNKHNLNNKKIKNNNSDKNNLYKKQSQNNDLDKNNSYRKQIEINSESENWKEIVLAIC